VTRHRLIAGLVAGAVLAVVARLILPAVPHLVTPVPLSQAATICGSSLGAFASAMNHQVAAACGEVSTVMLVLNLAALAGLALALVCGVVLWKRGRERQPSTASGRLCLLPGAVDMAREIRETKALAVDTTRAKRSQKKSSQIPCAGYTKGS
jgi:hypothetical protein